MKKTRAKKFKISKTNASLNFYCNCSIKLCSDRKYIWGNAKKRGRRLNTVSTQTGESRLGEPITGRTLAGSRMRSPNGPTEFKTSRNITPRSNTSKGSARMRSNLSRQQIEREEATPSDASFHGEILQMHAKSARKISSGKLSELTRTNELIRTSSQFDLENEKNNEKIDFNIEVDANQENKKSPLNGIRIIC